MTPDVRRPPSGALAAVVWDFDGTLADTRRRNFNVVRRLLADAGRPTDDHAALRSPEVYDRVNRGYLNWRELYMREFGLSQEETDRLGRLWSAYQLRDDTPVALFEGIDRALEALAHVGHGIVSQNARDQILRTLAATGLAARFRFVVGYDEVPIQRQKPEPDGLLACLEALARPGPGCALYVGDHETDVRCARGADRALAARGVPLRVISIAACFVGQVDVGAWAVQPDYVARSPGELVEIARSLAV